MFSVMMIIPDWSRSGLGRLRETVHAAIHVTFTNYKILLGYAGSATYFGTLISVGDWKVSTLKQMVPLI